ncbi:MAG TPA: hypothetical protein VF669_21170 [Tepidisphaeraceae bacterium]
MLSLESWLDQFELDGEIRARAAEVLGALPGEVLLDFLHDPAFVICDYEPGPGKSFLVPMRLGVKRPGRAVVLKRTLRSRPEDFARWVIAHELAHAHLRNGGRFEGDDPEVAADALAATWGFPKPRRLPWQ